MYLINLFALLRLYQQKTFSGIPCELRIKYYIFTVWITRSLASWTRETAETTLGAIRSRVGYAVWAERGRAGKVCATPYENDRKALSSVATSLCRALSFR